MKKLKNVLTKLLLTAVMALLMGPLWGNTTVNCNLDITTSNNSITVGNLNAAHIIVKLFGPDWSLEFLCNDDCNNPTTIDNLTEGATYYLAVNLYNDGWQSICSQTEYITVGSTACQTDVDNDGTCADEDCDDDNPAIPAPPGSVCDDGNPDTENDVIQADECTCLGTPVGCPDEDGDGVCADDDCDDTDPNLPTTPGTACDDGDANTENDVIQSDGCSCVGTPIGCPDEDGDGICADDDCDDTDPNLPATPGTACDDGDANTNNDVIQSDGCSCAGTPIGNNPCNVDWTVSNPSQTDPSFTITGLDAPHVIFKLFNPDWSIHTECFDNCTDPLTVSGLTSGVTYHFNYNLYDENWNELCEDTQDFSTTGGPGGEMELGCDLSYTVDGNDLHIDGDGLDAPHVIIKVFSPDWHTTHLSCFDDCGTSIDLAGLSDGTYHVSVDLYGENWQRTCDLLEDVVVGSPTPLMGNGEEVLFVQASRNGLSAIVNWVANNSDQTDHFVLERSTDGHVFEVVKEVAAQANTGLEYYYQITDSSPVAGYNFYRIRQVFNDGHLRYSAARLVTFDARGQDMVVYPNPASNKVFVNLPHLNGASATLLLYNSLGQPVQKIQVDAIDGATPIEVVLDHLPEGSYRLSVVDGTQLVTSRLVVVSRL